MLHNHERTESLLRIFGRVAYGEQSNQDLSGLLRPTIHLTWFLHVLHSINHKIGVSVCTYSVGPFSLHALEISDVPVDVYPCTKYMSCLSLPIRICVQYRQGRLCVQWILSGIRRYYRSARRTPRYENKTGHRLLSYWKHSNTWNEKFNFVNDRLICYS